MIMDNQKHTAEPWAVHLTRALIVPIEHLNRPVGGHVDSKIDFETYAQEICALHWPDRNRSEDEVKANARRIVACVNACAGIDNEYLESPDNLATYARRMAVQCNELLYFKNTVTNASPLLERCLNAELQRDELLVACKIAINIIGFGKEHDFITAAIAKAEGN